MEQRKIPSLLPNWFVTLGTKLCRTPSVQLEFYKTRFKFDKITPKMKGFYYLATLQQVAGMYKELQIYEYALGSLI